MRKSSITVLRSSCSHIASTCARTVASSSPSTSSSRCFADTDRSHARETETVQSITDDEALGIVDDWFQHDNDLDREGHSAVTPSISMPQMRRAASM